MLPMHYLLLSIASVLIKGLSAEWIGCGSPATFTIEVDNDKRVFIYDAEISVKYERNELAVYEYPDTNAVNILINNTAVMFSGHVLQESEEFDPTAFKTSRVLNTQIAGASQLIKSTYNDDTLTECDLYLSRNRKDDGGDLPARVQIEILHQAASCIRAEICRRLGKITLADVRNAKIHPYAFGPLKIITRTSSDRSENSAPGCIREQTMNANNLTSLVTSVGQLDFNNVNRDGLLSTINMLVDIAIAELVKKMRDENQGTIKIPDISQKFSKNSIWKPHGEFDAINGVFSDLTTLSRTEDAHLSHTGLKFVASCGFGLSKANIHYEKYKLKYGIHVSGELSASIDGVALATSVAIDYNQKPCRAILQDLRVTELGKMKIRLTGLGPLNKLTSKLVTWISKKWKEDIVTKVESKIRDIVEKHMNKFDCEKYRP